MAFGLYLREHARAILLLLLCIGAGLILYFALALPSDQKILRIVFLDVGQGDAIWIESPTGRQILIDSGPTRSVLRGISRELGFWDRTIDMVLLTHEDKDHVGGLPDVFKRYKVASFVRTENQSENDVADVIEDYVAEEGSDVVYARRGMVFDLGGGAHLKILFPDRDPLHLESNTSSIVARLVYGESEFLLTGDSPVAIETYLASQGVETLRSDVLKVGHHGSRTSTSLAFVQAVGPEFAVISSGKDNRYGHPHSEVVDILESERVTILNTADEGSIAFETDGRTLILK